MNRISSRALLGVVVGAVLVLGACGSDDGASVRNIGGDSSGSGSGSGSASGSRAGSASGSGAAVECEPVGDLKSADTRVNVTLDEWVVNPESRSVAAGMIGFVAENVGEEPHELVIVRGVAPADLPLDEHGSLDEAELPDGALIGEIEAFPAGETCDGTFELTAGEYTLICNISEKEQDGSTESHLDEGMVITFTVT